MAELFEVVMVGCVDVYIFCTTNYMHTLYKIQALPWSIILNSFGTKLIFCLINSVILLNQTADAFIFF